MFVSSFRWLSQFTQSPEGKLWDGEEAPAEGGISAPAAPAPASIPAAAPQVATPPAPAEDRSNWLPPHRGREIREAAAREVTQRYEAQMSQVRSELEQYRNQIRALVGVTPQNPQTQESEAIKSQFFQLFPWAKKLEERFGDVENLIDRGSDMEAQVNHYWTSYGNQSMDRLFKLASDSLGTPLTDDGKRQLHSSFVGYVQSSPELTDRYASDPTIVEDFWKQFTSSFVEPARRATGAGVATRAALGTRLPQDTPSGAPQTTPAPKPQNLDERAAMAWLEYQNRQPK